MNRHRIALLLLLLLLLALVAGACSSSPHAGSKAGTAPPATQGSPPSHSGPATTTATATSAGPRSAVSARCGPPDAAASLVRFRATDGTRLDGALVGSGR